MPGTVAGRISRNFADQKTRIMLLVGTGAVLMMVTAGAISIGKSAPDADKVSARVTAMSVGDIAQPDYDRHRTMTQRHADLMEKRETRRAEACLRDGKTCVSQIGFNTDLDWLNDAILEVPQPEKEAQARYVPSAPKVRVAMLDSNPIMAPVIHAPAVQQQPLQQPVAVHRSKAEQYRMMDAMVELLSDRRTAPQEVKVFVE
ncbi:MAG: hypothetical protein Alpg2KO_24350 [Alphaproteobacteria bacterium]